jgi:hypothetical protein
MADPDILAQLRASLDRWEKSVLPVAMPGYHGGADQGFAEGEGSSSEGDPSQGQKQSLEHLETR